jgi:ABC-type nitrate/sulfonate/bicarbonate transport system substrate-binding protein
MTNPKPNQAVRKASVRAKRLRTVGIAAAALVLLAGCATGASGSSGSTSSSKKLTTISFSLNYLPDTSLNGIAYAEKEGLFKKAGIALDIVPWGSTPSEQLVSSGQTQFGFSTDIRYALIAMASGADLVSYMATYEHVPYELTVLKDSKYDSPKDLSGTTYGGFGSPMELAVVNDMIAKDGGAKPADAVTLSTAAYDALASKRVASILTFPGDSYAIEKAGNAVRSFSTLDYGLPDGYAGLLVSSKKYVKANPEIARKFVAAVQAGYKGAVADPKTANDDLLKMFPKDLTKDLIDYVSGVQEKSLYVSADGVVGSQTAKLWQENADWLVSKGLLVDSSGAKLSSFDTSKLWSDKYLTK